MLKGWCQNMKKQLIWKIALFIGFIPFAAALLTGVYTMIVEGEHWTFPEYILLYSVIYWPYYLIGIIIIVFSLFRLKKR